MASGLAGPVAGAPCLTDGFPGNAFAGPGASSGIVAEFGGAVTDGDGCAGPGFGGAGVDLTEGLAPVAPGRRSGLTLGSSWECAGHAWQIANTIANQGSLLFDREHFIFTFGDSFGGDDKSTAKS